MTNNSVQQIESFRGLPGEQSVDGIAFRSQHVTVDGIDLHYVSGGNATPLLLLHGWPLTWYSWRKIMPELAKHFLVIAPDLPGLGDSVSDSASEPHFSFEKQNVARMMHEFIQQLGFSEVSILSHDMGVPIAYAYAAQFVGQVSRSVMLDVPINGFGLDEFARKLGLWHFRFFESKGLPEILTAGRERELISSFYPHYAPTAITPRDEDEYARTYANSQTMLAGLSYYRTFQADEQWIKERSKEKLALPLLAIGGEYAGAGFPFHCFAQLGTDVRGAILANCGHYHAEEKPTELLQLILPFLLDGLSKTN